MCKLTFLPPGGQTLCEKGQGLSGYAKASCFGHNELTQKTIQRPRVRYVVPTTRKPLELGGGVVMLKLLFLMSNYDPTYVYGVRDNIGTLLVTR